MCGQPIHCTCLCISHGLWVLGVGGWAKGWGGGQGGGPAQMLGRVYTALFKLEKSEKRLVESDTNLASTLHHGLPSY